MAAAASTNDSTTTTPIATPPNTGSSTTSVKGMKRKREPGDFISDKNDGLPQVSNTSESSQPEPMNKQRSSSASASTRRPPFAVLHRRFIRTTQPVHPTNLQQPTEDRTQTSNQSHTQTFPKPTTSIPKTTASSSPSMLPQLILVRRYLIPKRVQFDLRDMGCGTMADGGILVRVQRFILDPKRFAQVNSGSNTSFSSTPSVPVGNPRTGFPFSAAVTPTTPVTPIAPIPIRPSASPSSNHINTPRVVIPKMTITPLEETDSKRTTTNMR